MGTTYYVQPLLMWVGAIFIWRFIFGSNYSSLSLVKLLRSAPKFCQIVVNCAALCTLFVENWRCDGNDKFKFMENSSSRPGLCT
ncbi:hypothetical protein CASFOL_001759 [Castilleja foliolosa]|uniref:Uncharacterized protein n=1 Tax=Castilleja foliolosa TaxID=1961234 RepID=A0ABD3ECA8_9LAMI